MYLQKFKWYLGWESGELSDCHIFCCCLESNDSYGRKCLKPQINSVE